MAAGGTLSLLLESNGRAATFSLVGLGRGTEAEQRLAGALKSCTTEEKMYESERENESECEEWVV